MLRRAVAVAAVAALASPATALAGYGRAALISTGTPSAAAFRGMSADGSVVVFTTTAALVPADRDAVADLYAHAADGSVRLLTPGTTVSVRFLRLAADGGRLLFASTEALAEDGGPDGTSDVFERRADGTLHLVSLGDAVRASTFEGATADLGRTWFSSLGVAPGTAAAPGAQHLYERAGTDLGLVSSGSAADDATFVGASDDGSRVRFETAEPVAPAGDGDAFVDGYERGPGGLRLLSPGTEGADAHVRAVTDDGALAVVETAAAVPGTSDADALADVYVLRGPGLVLVSRGTPAQPARFAALAADGSRVLFTTAQAITGVELAPDVADDVFAAALPGGELALRSAGSAAATFLGASADASRVWYRTVGALAPDDADATADIYEGLDAAPPRLITAGVVGDAVLRGATADGRRVVYESAEPVGAGESGGGVTLYARRDDGTLDVVSGGTGSRDAGFGALTADGGRVAFTTDAALAPGDVDGQQDVFTVALPAPRVTVAVAGRRAVGGQLACAATVTSEASATLALAWLRDGTPLDGQAAERYLVARRDAGHALTCRATARTAAVGSARSTAAAAVIRPFVTGVRITGLPPVVGLRVRCDGTVEGGGPVAYAWLRGTRAIPRARTRGYRVRAVDAGHRLRCALTARNLGGTSTRTSPPALVAAP